MSDQDIASIIKSLRVLYVDDDRTILDAIQNPLSRRVAELYMATNGKEGLHIFDLYKPDIVITDIRLPMMDGLEMAREIRRENPHTPIVVVSSFSETDYFVRALDLGVSQYLFKPIEFDKLMTALIRCVRSMLLENALVAKNSELITSNKFLAEYKTAMDISMIVSRSDANGLITEVNDAFCMATGYDRKELIGQTYQLIAHPKEDREVKERIDYALKNRSIFRGQIRNRRKDTHSLYCDLTIVPILDESGAIVEVIDLRQDITQLMNRIYTDPLTGYPNRFAAVRDVELASQPLLAIFNIIGFGDVNDFYGDHIGDEILIWVTKLLRGILKDRAMGASVYKIAGDRFAVLLNDLSVCDNGVRQFVVSLIAQLEDQTFSYDGVEISLVYSAGYATTKNNAFAKADQALRAAKRRNQTVVCYEQMENVKSAYDHNISWTKQIRSAIANDRITPWFQPVIDRQTGAVVQYECLMRLVNDDGTIALPAEFLEIAYKARLNQQITRAMIRKSCDYFADRIDDFSINFTISEIQSRETVAFLKEELERTDTANRFIIELINIDAIMTEQLSTVDSFVEDMRLLGCRVSIDNFGSGGSNFEFLHRYKADFLKIDGTIISKIDSDRASLVIAETVAFYAKKLGIKVIAQHVHSEQISAILGRFEIGYSQGFLYAKPSAQVV
ncbi:hypothetical protein AGMMS50229_02970 [Campylobacterota bacterium]|nr:hypothetical protein AGMMS50229_02970 [Campylobacterota bacterium]